MGNWCNQVTDTGLQAIVAKLEQARLVDLNFSGCSQITDAGLVAVGAGLSSLKELFFCIDECSLVTAAGLQNLLYLPAGIMGLRFKRCWGITNAGLRSMTWPSRFT